MMPRRCGAALALLAIACTADSPAGGTSSGDTTVGSDATSATTTTATMTTSVTATASSTDGTSTSSTTGGSTSDGSTTTSIGDTSGTSSESSSSGEGPVGPDCDVGEPIDAVAETWTWIPFDDTQCAFAGTAGIAINPAARSTRLVIEFQGGGGCFAEDDCAAVWLDGIDVPTQLDALASRPIYDRDAPSNPFAEYSYVFVPYCTGDFHMGDNVSSYGANHVGYANMQAFLERIVPTFCDVERVVVVGASAGGFGATFNYPRIHDAYGSTPVDLIADSGPFLLPEAMVIGVQDLLDENWGFRANLPAECDACDEGWHGLYPFAADRYPDDRMSLVSSLFDASIQSRFAPYTPLQDTYDFRLAVEALADDLLAPLPNMRVYFLQASGHVYVPLEQLDQVVSEGVTLETFLRAQLDGDDDWASVRP